MWRSCGAHSDGYVFQTSKFCLKAQIWWWPTDSDSCSLKWQAHFIGFSFQVWITSSGLSDVLSRWWCFMGEWLIRHSAPVLSSGTVSAEMLSADCVCQHREHPEDVLQGCDWTWMILLPKDDIPECVLGRVQRPPGHFAALFPRCRTFTHHCFLHRRCKCRHSEKGRERVSVNMEVVWSRGPAAEAVRTPGVRGHTEPRFWWLFVLFFWRVGSGRCSAPAHPVRALQIPPPLFCVPFHCVCSVFWWTQV